MIIEISDNYAEKSHNQSFVNCRTDSSTISAIADDRHENRFFLIPWPVTAGPVSSELGRGPASGPGSVFQNINMFFYFFFSLNRPK